MGEAAERETVELVVVALRVHEAPCTHVQVVRVLVTADGRCPGDAVGIKVLVAIRVDTARPNYLITIVIKI